MFCALDTDSLLNVGMYVDIHGHFWRYSGFCNVFALLHSGAAWEEVLQGVKFGRRQILLGSGCVNLEAIQRTSYSWTSSCALDSHLRLHKITQFMMPNGLVDINGDSKQMALRRGGHLPTQASHSPQFS